MFAISQPVSRTSRNQTKDVRQIEDMLARLEHLDIKPTDGSTGYFGARVEDAIRGFQKDQGLKVDGRLNPDGETIKAMAATLQGMGRNGDTVLAHLTPEEAWLLDQITDGGSINPTTGLPEFWNGDNESRESYDAGAASDAQAAENNAQGNAGRSAEGGDPAGYGDMTPVNAVNRARAQAQARERDKQTRQAAERQRAEKARNKKQALIARGREQRARMQDLAERTERARRARALAWGDEDTRATNQARQVQKARQIEKQAKVKELEQQKELERKAQLAKQAKNARAREQNAIMRSLAQHQNSKPNQRLSPPPADPEKVKAVERFVDNVSDLIMYAIKAPGPNIMFLEDSMKMLKSGKNEPPA